MPAPGDVFGFEPGADYELATNDQVLAYFRRLDAASDRVVVEEIGKSVLGRPMILAYISSAENIARLEEHRRTAEALARGRIPPEEARARAADGKAVVWIDGGLHATELASAQHTPLLAWRVAAEETPEMRRIRDDVILLLMPVMNPDGLDLVADWAKRSIGTPWERSSPPVLYQFYTGHDNNRDWFMITQPETRAVTDVIYNRWYPQIVEAGRDRQLCELTPGGPRDRVRPALVAMTVVQSLGVLAAEAGNHASILSLCDISSSDIIIACRYGRLGFLAACRHGIPL